MMRSKVTEYSLNLQNQAIISFTWPSEGNVILTDRGVVRVYGCVHFTQGKVAVQ